MEFQKSNLQVVPVVDKDEEALSPDILVSKFDYSVENHFEAMEKIAILSKESEFQYEQTDIERLSSSVTFLREWKYFCYQPRAIRFACETETPQEKDVRNRINLPQFSSAAVPKDLSDGKKVSSPLSKDFVMNVGGHVWALDWCPKVHQTSDRDIKVEFIAVAAHPPDSSYHKIGAPLTGRGLIQVWCMLTSGVKDQDPGVKVKATRLDLNQPKKPRGRPRKNALVAGFSMVEKLNSEGSEVINVNPTEPKKPKGRPKKTITEKYISNLNDNDSCPQPLSIEFPQITHNTPETVDNCGNPDAEILKIPKSHDQETKKEKALNERNSEEQDSRLAKRQKRVNLEEEPLLLEDVPNRESISEDIALPRFVMGLAHNGKVAWDVKWKPFDSSNSVSNYRMGYLAVLLGNGALEVWEVPVPRVTKSLFSSCKKENTDPRFVKLKPVFMCSKLTRGDRQSIPLTLEWSTSAPHDLILAGCHDGVVALWKFSANALSEDTRPLLCFNADTVPIRALKWAPVPSDPESANIIATAGHNGLKFYDIRDPFHPLWDISSQKIIYSLDWVPDPRCVVYSSDDGEIRVIVLSKAANEGPVTGTLCKKTQQSGSNSLNFSSSPIWNVHVSTLTGMVAYCCSDGKVISFELTTRSVEKEHYRNREPHFLCGSISVEEDTTLVVFSPLPDQFGDTPKSRRTFVTLSNQEKRGKDQNFNKGLEERALVVAQTKSKSKSKNSQTLVCVDDDGKKSEEENLKEELPSKIVAMHRVRWNMNKGSERWLCYGGAAGILRCQEVNLWATTKVKR